MRREPNTHSLASKLGLQGILDTIINLCTSPYLVAVIAFIVVLIPSFFSSERAKVDHIDVDVDTYDALTFVTAPWQLFSEELFARYKITLSSWLLTSPHTRLILFVEPDFDKHDKLKTFLTEKFGADRFIISRQLHRDQTNSPYINEYIQKGVELARSRNICFMNTDIMVDPLWYDRVMAIAKVYAGKGYYITGQRIDLHHPEYNDDVLAYNTTLYAQLKKELTVTGAASCFEQLSSDYFVMSADPVPFAVSNIPKFVMGGYFWDQYLNWMANSKTHAVTMRRDAPVYHIGNPPMTLPLEEKAKYNLKILKEEKLEQVKNAELYTKLDRKVLRADKVIELPVKDLETLVPVPTCVGEEIMPDVHV